MSKKIKPFLFIVIIFAIALPLLSFWVIRYNSARPSDTFLIHNVALTTELDKHRRITGTISRFSYGARQVCLRFDYSRVTAGSTLQVEWRCGEKLVKVNSYELSESSGSKIYCLLLENGQPIPRGIYSIGLIYRSERIPDFRFEIY